jgi:Tfp pilus assembly protein PilF
MFGVCSVLAYLYDRWGKHKEAADFYRKALDLSQQSGPWDPEKVATMQNNLAMLLKKQQEYDRAQGYYEEALAGFRVAHGNDGLSVASVCNNLGILFYQNLEEERAREMYLEALRILEQARRSEAHPAELRQTCMNLAAVYKALGDFQNAQNFVERARGLHAPLPGAAVGAERRSTTLMLDRSV